MAKQTGITALVVIDDSGGTPRTISGDVTNFDTSQVRALQDVTGVDKDAVERLPLIADFTLNLSGVVNTTSNNSHTVFASMGTAIRSGTVGFSNGGTVTAELAVANYNITRAQGGELTWQATLQLANGTAASWS